MKWFNFNTLKKMKDENIKKEEEINNKETENAQQEVDTNEKETETKDKKDNKKDKQKETKKESLEDKVESLGVKLQEVNDKYLRLYSEFENYRKRTSKEKIDLISTASEEVIKDLLPVVDDYERALASIEKIEDENVKAALEGITLIYKKLYSVLERRGLKPINAKGETFDENLHEAIAQIPATKEEDKDKVIDETTKGYYLNDKVIRYSKVVVAK
jgi:molecular chaperone GrpE